MKLSYIFLTFSHFFIFLTSLIAPMEIACLHKHNKRQLTNNNTKKPARLRFQPHWNYQLFWFLGIIVLTKSLQKSNWMDLDDFECVRTQHRLLTLKLCFGRPSNYHLRNLTRLLSALLFRDLGKFLFFLQKITLSWNRRNERRKVTSPPPHQWKLPLPWLPLLRKPPPKFHRSLMCILTGAARSFPRTSLTFYRTILPLSALEKKRNPFQTFITSTSSQTICTSFAYSTFPPTKAPIIIF